MLLHLVLGVALGALSSLVPGPCGLAVMTAAASRGLGRTLAIAAGGGLGDGTYAALGLVGVAPLVALHPIVPALLQAASGVALVGFGLARLLARRVGSGSTASPTNRSGGIAAGVVIGLGAVLANPGALLSWAAVGGALVAGAGALDAAATVVGIAAGSAAWLATLGLVARARRSSRDDVLRHVASAVGVLLALSGVLALARATLLLAG